MARFRSNKRAKELNRKAKHEAKEARKKERQEKSASGEGDPDIDWSAAVGLAPQPEWHPPGFEPETQDGADASEAPEEEGRST